MDWQVSKRDWPNRDLSRLVECRPHLWHVQESGAGPHMLLLHGAGGATHSWRDVVPNLARDHRVIAPDLPGQGFTRMGTRQRSGLDTMAADLLQLCHQEDCHPDILVGHSAGAALALRMAEIMQSKPRVVVGINAALGTFKGLSGWLFPVMAKALAATPLTPALVSSLPGADARVRALLDSTGSKIDDRGQALYARLSRDPGHLEGTLAMMAQWHLEGLLARLQKNDVPVLLIVGDRDGTVPPDTSETAAARLPNAEVIHMADLGHLAHEEAPDRVCNAIRSFLSRLP